MSDKETAIKDIIRDYERRGKRFLENYAQDLEETVRKHTRECEIRKRETSTSLNKLNEKVIKNLKLKSQSEELKRKVKEEEMNWREQLENAMALYDYEIALNE